MPGGGLSAVVRGKLLAAFEAAAAAGKIASAPELLRRAARKSWVIYCKRPFAGPQQVLAYLGRYTHRIAIGNERIVAMSGGDVTFFYRDRRDGDRRKDMTLPAASFLRRFLLHVLPRGFVHIRHYGLLANSVRRGRIALCREVLGVPPQEDADADVPGETWEEILLRLTGEDVTCCPQCGVEENFASRGALSRRGMPTAMRTRWRRRDPLALHRRLASPPVTARDRECMSLCENPVAKCVLADLGDDEKERRACRTGSLVMHAEDARAGDRKNARTPIPIARRRRRARGSVQRVLPGIARRDTRKNPLHYVIWRGSLHIARRCT